MKRSLLIVQILFFALITAGCGEKNLQDTGNKTTIIKGLPTEVQVAETETEQLLTPSAVDIDIGEAKNIHPKNKQDVGKRLALSALKIAYEKDIVASGPVYRSMKVENSSVRLSFDSIGSSLTAKGGVLKGFAVAGRNKKVFWAEALIKGDEVIISSPALKEPVAVRSAGSTVFNG